MRDKIMSKEFKVLDRFHLPNLGTVYSVKGPAKVDLYLHDILYDIQGNRFEIEAVEQCEYWEIPKDPPQGLLLKEIDGVSVQGDRLAKNMEDFGKENT